MNDFTHLHVHSHYSLLDGLGKLDALIERTKELGMNSLAITDHGAMYGVIEFVQAAQEAGIKQIIGMEGYLAPNGHDKKRGKVDANPRHIGLIAMNDAGYKNLIQLSTKAFLQGYYYKPRIDYDLLEQHCEGLIVLSGCLNGDISKAILEKSPEELKETWKEHPEAVDRTQKIADMCDVPFEFGKNKLPRFPLPKNETPDNALKNICE